MTIFPLAEPISRADEASLDGYRVRPQSDTPHRCYVHGNGLPGAGRRSCCANDHGAVRVVPHSRGDEPEVTSAPCGEFYVIARLDVGDSAADVYSSDISGGPGEPRTAGWARTLRVQPGTAADLDGLDRTLAASGYWRTGSWREQITAGGVLRYFAEATLSPHTR